MIITAGELDFLKGFRNFYVSIQNFFLLQHLFIYYYLNSAEIDKLDYHAYQPLN